jgi:Flp pilus assembly protein TadG
MARSKTSSRVSLFGRLMRPKAFWRANKGSAAVEFALVALPFFALIGGVIELGLIFMAQVLLDNAMSTATRQIRTGYTQSATTAAMQQIQLDNFKHDVCLNMGGWMAYNCQDNLTLSVDNYPNFAAVPLTSPITGSQLKMTENFNTGLPGGIVVVRGYYQWALFMPVLNKALVRTPGRTLLTSIAAFVNEPFVAAPPTTVVAETPIAAPGP